MALIVTAVYDTEENGRTGMTIKCLTQLRNTLADGDKTAVYDNGSCLKTRDALDGMKSDGIIDYLHHGEENIGISRAVNFLFKRYSTPDGIKGGMDSDCFIHDKGWTDIAREVFRRSPGIGLIALKEPLDPEYVEPGEIEFVLDDKKNYWILIEHARWPLGVCQLYRPELIEKIGYLTQPAPLYGFSDILLSIRAEIAGFKTVYLPHIRIDHIHEAMCSYQLFKHKCGADYIGEFEKMKNGYISGELDIYYGGE